VVAPNQIQQNRIPEVLSAQSIVQMMPS